MNFGDPIPLPYTETTDGPLIYGGSIGINRIIEYFSKQIDAHGHVPWLTYLINLDTVYRNVEGYTNKLTHDKDVIDAMVADIALFTTYADLYNKTQEDVYILLYIPNYKDMHKYGVPRISESDMIVDRKKRFASIINKIIPRIPQKLGSVKLYLCSCNKMPHEELPDAIRQEIPRIDRNAHTLLLSHHPIDLHLAKSFKRLSLIESYTGVIKNHKEFGTKLTTNDPKIPFNKVTHRIFGDKVDIKSPYSTAHRKLLYEFGLRKKWYLFTESEIERDIEFVIKANNITSKK